MPIYMQSTIEVSGAGIESFLATMPQAVAYLEATAGWRLAGAFMQLTGRMYTVIDLWALDDANHYHSGLQRLVEAPFFPEFKAVLDRVVVRETIVLLDPVPYMHGQTPT